MLVTADETGLTAGVDLRMIGGKDSRKALLWQSRNSTGGITCMAVASRPSDGMLIQKQHNLKQLSWACCINCKRLSMSYSAWRWQTEETFYCRASTSGVWQQIRASWCLVNPSRTALAVPWPSPRRRRAISKGEKR